MTCFLNEHHSQKLPFSPLSLPSQSWANSSRQQYIRTGTPSPVTPHSPPFGHANPYQPIKKPVAYTTILSTLHKHMAPHNRNTNATTHIHPHTPLDAYPQICLVLTLWTTQWYIKTCNEDQLWRTPTHSS